MYRALRPAIRDPQALRAGVALPLRRGGDPALLPARALLRPPHQLRRDRQLALLDHPPVGRGILRAVRDRPRRRDVRRPGPGHGPHRHARHLPGRHPLPGRRDRGDRAPLVLHRPGDAQHGPGRVLLGARGGPAHPPHPRRLGLHPPPGAALRRLPGDVRRPSPLGDLLPDGRGLLELRRRRGLRLPDQPADRLLLRGRHVADEQPRPRGALRRLRDAGARGARLLPALAGRGRGLGARRALDPGGLLGNERRARAHDGDRPVPGRRPAAVGRPARTATGTRGGSRT